MESPELPIQGLPTPEHSTSAPLPRRRNGKQQSCEPCRLGKIACDHSLPKCNRCIRRGVGARCTYHPAPMTKTQRPTKDARRLELARRRSSGVPGPNTDILSLLSQQQSPSATPEEFPNPAQATEDQSQYHGSTSFSAIFQENRESIGGELWNHSEDLNSNQGHAVAHSSRLSLALSILRAIPDQDVCELLLDYDFELDSTPLHEQATKYCLQSLWEAFGDALRNRENEISLRQMAEEILKNTDTPPKPCRTSAEWLQSYTGKNIRFEIIGTLLCLFGLAVPDVPDKHPLLRHLGVDARQYMLKLGVAAEKCQSICMDLSVVNEFTLYFMYHAQLMQAVYRSEDVGRHQSDF